MKQMFALSGFLIFALLSSPASASSCMGIFPPATDWVRSTADGSTYIFSGVVTRVVPNSTGQDVYVTVQEHLKGKFIGVLTTNNASIHFKIRPGDKRVFFAARDKSIIGCSDYKDYLTDFGVLKELRYVLRPGT